MTTTKEEAIRVAEKWKGALDKLSTEDKRLLNLLRLMGEVVDRRYELKSIRLLVARALVDPEFRSRLVGDTDEILSELRGHSDLPENLRVRCVENSTHDLTIVLPPPSAALSEKSRTIRDFIVSRTSARLTSIVAGVDDNDITPHFADPVDPVNECSVGIRRAAEIDRIVLCVKGRASRSTRCGLSALPACALSAPP